MPGGDFSNIPLLLIHPPGIIIKMVGKNAYASYVHFIRYCINNIKEG